MTVETPEIDQVLTTASESVASGAGLAGTGFWRAVNAIKKDSELVGTHAARVAGIDQAAFAQWAWFKVGFRTGTTLMIVGTLVGLGLVAWAYYLEDLLAVLAFFAGVGIVLVTTHGLGHLVVGSAVGIRFTGWFVGTPKQPQPGVKVDYESYLRVPARRRAWMHASGALVTKAIPFLLLPSAIAAGLPAWSVWVLALVGLATIITDIAWSTKSSDWKKFRREMSLSQTS